MHIEDSSTEEIERQLIEEHAGHGGHFESEKDKQLSEHLLASLDEEQHEGERKYEFEKRMRKKMDQTVQSILGVSLEEE